MHRRESHESAARRELGTVTQRADEYRFLGSGRGRAAFLSPNGRWVAKVPWNEQGAEANRNEADRYAEWARPWLARCRMLRMSEILVMEQVDVMPYARAINHALGRRVDSAQIGTCRDGVVRAFDYGDWVSR